MGNYGSKLAMNNYKMCSDMAIIQRDRIHDRYLSFLGKRCFWLRKFDYSGFILWNSVDAAVEYQITEMKREISP